MTRRSEGVLTPAERTVLTLRANGHTVESIAAQGRIAQGTVQAHLRNVGRKLGTVGSVQAVAVALKLGEISLGDVLVPMVEERHYASWGGRG